MLAHLKTLLCDWKPPSGSLGPKTIFLGAETIFLEPEITFLKIWWTIPLIIIIIILEPCSLQHSSYYSIRCDVSDTLGKLDTATHAQRIPLRGGGFFFLRGVGAEGAHPPPPAGFWMFLPSRPIVDDAKQSCFLFKFWKYLLPVFMARAPKIYANIGLFLLKKVNSWITVEECRWHS